MAKKSTEASSRNVTIDRRVVRTRKTLQDALVLLIQKHNYNAITVEDICGAANVGRSTFYTHYPSKNALKLSGLEALHKELRARQHLSHNTEGDTATGGFQFTLTLFEHASEWIDHFRALAGSRGVTVARDKIQTILTKLIRDELAQRRNKFQNDAFHREAVHSLRLGHYCPF